MRAAALAVGAPGDDDRHPLDPGRAEDVDVDRRSVAKCDSTPVVQSVLTAPSKPAVVDE